MLQRPPSGVEAATSAPASYARPSYIDATNDEPRPFVWTKSADEILASVARFCAHTLADS
jgi:Tol biopolymer transport system component